MLYIMLIIYWGLFLTGVVKDSWTLMIVVSIVWIILSPIIEAIVSAIVPEGREE